MPPYDRLAVITGEVKRPMAYELADSETAANLVAMVVRAFPELSGVRQPLGL